MLSQPFYEGDNRLVDCIGVSKGVIVVIKINKAYFVIHQLVQVELKPDP